MPRQQGHDTTSSWSNGRLCATTQRPPTFMVEHALARETAAVFAWLKRAQADCALTFVRDCSAPHGRRVGARSPRVSQV
eukprot:6599356-Alexandrium_andersonii.AAC.1